MLGERRGKGKRKTTGDSRERWLTDLAGNKKERSNWLEHHKPPSVVTARLMQEPFAHFLGY